MNDIPERDLEPPEQPEHARECLVLTDHKGEYEEEDCTCGYFDILKGLKK